MRELDDYPMREVIRGDRLEINLQVVKVVDYEEVVPDITNYTFIFSIKETIEDSMYIYRDVYDGLVVGGITLTDPTNGWMRIVVEGGLTTSWDLKDYVADVQMLDDQGDGPYTVRKEIIRVKSDITR